MNRLVSEQKLTPSGRDWLVAALDPFHDTQLANLEGWPDLECGASVVRCIKQSITVAVPNDPNFPAGQNWDCHIVAWPWLNGGNTTMYQSGARLNNSYLGVSIPFAGIQAPVGGLQIYAVKPNQPLSILQPANGSTYAIGRIDLNPLYSAGSGRLIGGGYEVHNTTAELYKQGSVCCYRQQADARAPSTFVCQGPSNAYTQTYTGIQVRYPPSTVAEAMLTSGSRQWSAEEGMYQVYAFMSEENPAMPIPMESPVISSLGNAANEGTLNSFSLNVPMPRAVVTGTTLSPTTTSRVHPIHQSGCIFTGLSYQTTLTINLNLYYESFPSNDDLDILVMAKPSCKYDPSALEFYSRVMTELPVGVPVCENGLGDWFLDAASTAAKYIGPALSLMPHPIAKGAGAALTYLGETGQNYVKRQQPPNAWEQQGGGAVVSARDAAIVQKQAVHNAVQKQKNKDKKKINKAKAQKALKK